MDNGDPLPSVDTLPGSFHFLAAECTHDDDCPDDGIFCNGVEVCQTGDCVLTEPARRDCTVMKRWMCAGETAAAIRNVMTDSFATV